MNISVRLEKIEKELLWESLVPSQELRSFMKRYAEITPGTEEGIRYYTLLKGHLVGIESAVSRLRAMGVTDTTSLKFVLASLSEPFRTAVNKALASLISPNREAKVEGEEETERE